MNAKFWSRRTVLAVFVGSTFVLTGCASEPTPAEIYQQENVEELHWSNWRDRELRHCITQACRDRTEQTYNMIMVQIARARQAALAGDWAAERKIREDLINKLLGLIPDFNSVKQFLPKSSVFFEDYEISADLTFLIDGQPVYGGLVPSSGSTDPSTLEYVSFSTVPPCLTGTLKIEGTVSGNPTGSWETLSFAAELQGGECTTSGGITTTRIKGGTFKIVLDGLLGTPIYGTLNASYPASATIAADGTGMLDCIMTLSTPAVPWLNWLNGDFHIPLPIAAHADHSLGVIVTPQYFRRAIPRPYSLAADFNQDGVLDNNDRIAFLAGLNANDPLADRNADGAWTQSDIDSWEEEFGYENALHR